MTQNQLEIRDKMSVLEQQKKEVEDELDALWGQNVDYYPGYQSRNDTLQQKKSDIVRQIERLELQLGDRTEGERLPTEERRQTLEGESSIVKASRKKLREFVQQVTSRRGREGVLKYSSIFNRDH